MIIELNSQRISWVHSIVFKLTPLAIFFSLLFQVLSGSHSNCFSRKMLNCPILRLRWKRRWERITSDPLKIDFCYPPAFVPSRTFSSLPWQFPHHWHFGAILNAATASGVSCGTLSLVLVQVKLLFTREMCV